MITHFVKINAFSQLLSVSNEWLFISQILIYYYYLQRFMLRGHPRQNKINHHTALKIQRRAKHVPNPKELVIYFKKQERYTNIVYIESDIKA